MDKNMCIIVNVHIIFDVSFGDQMIASTYEIFYSKSLKNYVIS